MNIRDRLAGLAPLPKTAFAFVALLIFNLLGVWLLGEEPRIHTAALSALLFAGFMYWRYIRHER
ncbi:MAG: hypothetical protein WEA24_09990 [Gemmatimonadota bacterium]